MRILNASIMIVPLALLGALPAAAGQPGFAPGAGIPLRIAAAGDQAPDRETYAHQAQDQMQEWQRKLDAFGTKVETSGKQAGNAADADLKDAWAKARVASERLQKAGADTWDGAKAAFDQASHDLANSWHKIHPDDK